MSFKTQIVTPPAEEPVTQQEAKDHARVSDSTEDTLISAYIVAARQMAEILTGRALVTQTWKLFLDEFPEGDEIVVPYPLLQSVTHIKYYNQDGDLTTLDSSFYVTDEKAEPGIIYLADGEVWPSTEDGRPNSVEIQFVAGYGDAADVPETIKLAIKFLVSHWYENREPSSPAIVVQDVPKTFDWLLLPHSIVRLG